MSDSTIREKNMTMYGPERIVLGDESNSNFINIMKCLGEIETQSKQNFDESSNQTFIDSFVIDECLSLLNQRNALKYTINTSLLSRAFNIFYTILVTARLPFPVKTKLLNQMHLIVVKSSTSSTLKLVSIDWQLLWTEAMDYATRRKKDQSLANTDLISEYTSAIVCFLHDCRSFLIRTEREADQLVDEAMFELKDMRHTFSVEHLLKLYTCLPTAYAGILLFYVHHLAFRNIMKSCNSFVEFV